MQRFRWLVILGALCLIAPLIRADSPDSYLLTQKDYELEQSSREERPALSSLITAKERWESYDEWRCFPMHAVELTCVEIDYGGWRKSPTIVATSGGHLFEYSLDPTFKWDCEFTLNEWRSVIGDSSEVCMFGAYLQPLEEVESLWVLSQLKSERGYWKEYESEAYRHAQRELPDVDDECPFKGFQSQSRSLRASLPDPD